MRKFKKNKNEAIGSLYNMYSIYHIPAKRWRGTFYHTTDEEAIRVTLPGVLMDYALRDIELYKIGTFDDVTGEVTPCPKVKVNTLKYTFPHSQLSSKGDDLSLEVIDEKMKEFKAQELAKLSANPKDMEVAEEEKIEEA